MQHAAASLAKHGKAVKSKLLCPFPGIRSFHGSLPGRNVLYNHAYAASKEEEQEVRPTSRCRSTSLGVITGGIRVTFLLSSGS